ncbi:hypothetical protein [Streptomyces sp. NPDC088812]|uniref:hypothetical protein n=1 Tax=Streptomyces sp. NPDC088812 TaxID=3365905 RepID=UPI0037F3CDC1
MKFDMGAQTLSTLMRHARGSSDDLGEVDAGEERRYGQSTEQRAKAAVDNIG